MNKKLRFLALVIAAVAVCFAFTACSSKNNGEDVESEVSNTETEINYDDTDVEQYVKDVQYKDLEISLSDENTTKEDAVWNAIYATATVVEYPEEKVNYYFNQMKDAYMHCAHGNEADYLLLLKARGTSEEDMLERARNMVKEDLVYRYIVKREGIVITEDEKNELFEKYVNKYSAELGKTPEYVTEYMSEYIYESMLYDKTTEYLFAVNTFVSK